MNRRNQLGTALIGVAVVLFVVPAAFPVQPMLTHDTGWNVQGGAEELEDGEFRVVAFENLSERGQELYRQTLENGGEYRVPVGEGADDFDYLTAQERRQAREDGDRSGIRGVAVERSEDADLPSADERYFGPRGDDEDSEVNETALRQQAMRFDAVQTSTERPPLGSPPQLIRLGAVVLAVVLLGTGGYLLSSK